MQLTVDPTLGAYHGSELNQLFDTTTTLGGLDTPAEAATGHTMRAAWAAFAKDPRFGLARPPFRWPALPSNSTGIAQTVHLGLPNATAAVIQPASQGDALCPQVVPSFEALGGVNGVTALLPRAIPLLVGIQDGDVLAVVQALLQAVGEGGQ